MNKKVLLKVNKDSDLKCPVDGFILGLDNFSYLFEKTYSYEEIKKIKENINKEIYVSFNKLIFNSELTSYKSLLKKIDNLGIDGIIIGDLAALTYNLKTNIILDLMHLNNSYLTINHYYNNGVNGIFLTNDITKDEINEIRKNTNIKLLKQVFGYPHLSTSSRNLISNYLEYFKIDKKIKRGFIKEDNSDNYYPIINEDGETHILGSKKLNLLRLYDKLEIDYAVIDGYFIDDISIVVDSFMNNKKENSDLIDKKYDCDTGFIDKKTIYKVKKDEK